MTDAKDPRLPTAIASQLRWLANIVERETCTGFAIEWDGAAPTLTGQLVVDVAANIRALTGVAAKAAEAAPPAEDPDRGSSAN